MCVCGAQAEEQLRIVEEQRKIHEERMKLEQDRQKQQKEEQSLLMFVPSGVLLMTNVVAPRAS